MGANEEFCVECQVTFLLADEGGPSDEYWPKKFTDYYYRPCLVFGDPNQRQAKITSKDIEVELDNGSKHKFPSDRFIDEPYIGVAFKYGPQKPKRGESFNVILVPFSQDADSIKKFAIDATFTIREGAKMVGFGRVLRSFYVPNEQSH